MHNATTIGMGLGRTTPSSLLAWGLGTRWLLEWAYEGAIQIEFQLAAEVWKNWDEYAGEIPIQLNLTAQYGQDFLWLGQIPIQVSLAAQYAHDFSWLGEIAIQFGLAAEYSFEALEFLYEGLLQIQMNLASDYSWLGVFQYLGSLAIQLGLASEFSYVSGVYTRIPWGKNIARPAIDQGQTDIYRIGPHNWAVYRNHK